MQAFLARHGRIFIPALLTISAAWIFISAILWPASMATQTRAPQVGFLAPDFELALMDGGSVRLSELAGKVVLVNLWASWCPPCRAEMPAIQRVEQAYREEGLVVLAVNASAHDSLTDARAFLEQNNFNFPVLLDKGDEVYRQYHIQALPSSFFIARDGRIRKVVIGGPMPEALLRIEVERLLAEER